MAIKDPAFGDATGFGAIQNPPADIVKPPLATRWADLGVYVGPTAPLNPVTALEWLAGAGPYFAWLDTSP